MRRAGRGRAGGGPGGGPDGSSDRRSSRRSRAISHTSVMTAITTRGGQEIDPPSMVSPSARIAASTSTEMTMTLRVASRTERAERPVVSSGTTSHSTAYTRRPAPPKKIATTKRTRTIVGSTSRWRATPPATPPIFLSS